ncbi:MAG: hypothetical protein KAI24_03160, partial [Planctomycetes bacterium]|nr:hypothetical protein [Planctomycetota bacterium]
MSDPIPASSPTSSTAAGSKDAFLSSGQSPGEPAADARASLHLVGPGQVGRAFLRQLLQRGDAPRVVAISDRSGTTYRREGLPVEALLTHKAQGRALAAWPGAEAIPTELAIRVVSAEVVVDATPSAAEGTDDAIRRGDAALRSGAALALCSKSALARRAAAWLAP